jgi:chromate reductase
VKKILAISGSLRAGSSNHNILRYLGTLVPAGVKYVIFDGIAQMQLFDPGMDVDPAPIAVNLFRQAIADADGVVICTPEYAYGVPGALKNALDWTVSSGSLTGKPLALITAATGGENTHAAFQLIFGALSTNVIRDAVLLISFIRSKMDANGNVKDADTLNSLNAAFDAFLKAI